MSVVVLVRLWFGSGDDRQGVGSIGCLGQPRVILQLCLGLERPLLPMSERSSC
jgi:hypothetical protein